MPPRFNKSSLPVLSAFVTVNDHCDCHNSAALDAADSCRAYSELEYLLRRIAQLLQDAGQLALRLVLGLVAADGVHHGRRACMRRPGCQKRAGSAMSMQ